MITKKQKAKNLKSKQQDLDKANKTLFTTLINKASKPLPLKKKTKV